VTLTVAVMLTSNTLNNGGGNEGEKVVLVAMFVLTSDDFNNGGGDF